MARHITFGVLGRLKREIENGVRHLISIPKATKKLYIVKKNLHLTDLYEVRISLYLSIFLLLNRPDSLIKTSYLKKIAYILNIRSI